MLSKWCLLKTSIINYHSLLIFLTTVLCKDMYYNSKFEQEQSVKSYANLYSTITGRYYLRH